MNDDTMPPETGVYERPNSPHFWWHIKFPKDWKALYDGQQWAEQVSLGTSNRREHGLSPVIRTFAAWAEFLSASSKGVMRNNWNAVPLLFALVLTSCGGSDPVDPSVVIYRSLESRQCEGGGKTVEDVEALAKAAGVLVRGSSCGSDGLGRGGVCGSGDGWIALLEIPQSQSQVAFANGFYSVDGLPFAKAPCNG